MKFIQILWLALLLALCVPAAMAQAMSHHHHMMGQTANARIVVKDDPVAHTLTVRIGPVNLPAHASHDTAAQPPEFLLDIPVEGWIIGYHPRLTDAAGNPVPNRMLHHVAFWNTHRSDFLCPNKEEHIFGAGGEMNDWPELPGLGYRVTRQDRIRIDTMFHNPTDTNYPETYLQVTIDYLPASSGTPLKSVYPAWFDAQQCGDSGYELKPGKNVAAGEFKLAYSGRLVGVGGHMHDYGKQLVLNDETQHKDVAVLDATSDAAGHLLSMPIVTFMPNGYVLTDGQKMKVTATYENPTGKPLPDGAMGIVVGYFLPDDDTRMNALVRPAEKGSIAAR